MPHFLYASICGQTLKLHLYLAIVSSATVSMLQDKLYHVVLTGWLSVAFFIYGNQQR